MNLWKELSTGPNSPDTVRVIVEVAKGSRVRYGIKSENNLSYLALEEVMFAPMFYQGNYGIIPHTLWEDGKPLGAFVLMDEAVQPQCVISARPVALLSLLVDDVRSDKVVCVAEGDPRASKVLDVKDLNQSFKSQMSAFFGTQEGSARKVEILGWKGVDQAKKAIVHAQKVFKAKIG